MNRKADSSVTELGILLSGSGPGRASLLFGLFLLNLFHHFLPPILKIQKNINKDIGGQFIIKNKDKNILYGYMVTGSESVFNAGLDPMSVLIVTEVFSLMH